MLQKTIQIAQQNYNILMEQLKIKFHWTVQNSEI